MLARLLLLVVAVIACAWFAVGARQAINTDRASALISPGSRLGPRQAANASSLLDAARWLNPDREIDVLRSKLALEQGHPAEAQQILERVTRDEPQNLAAWLVLLQATLNRHQPIFDVAVKALIRLDPRLR